MQALFTIASILTAALLFLFFRFNRKTGTSAALLFSVTGFLMTGFLTGIVWEFVYSVQEKPKVHFLLDASASCRGDVENIRNDARFQALARNPRVVVSWFSDRPAKRAADLNPEWTACRDSINRYRNGIPANDKVVVISDFQDNASVASEVKRNADIGILAGITNIPGMPVLAAVQTPEFLEPDESETAKFQFFSDRKQEVILGIFDTDARVTEKKTTAEAGWNETAVEYTVKGRKERLLRFQVSAAGAKNGPNSKIEKMIAVVDSPWKILLVCGRPSPEFAYLRRYLERLRLVRTDIRLLVSKTDHFQLPSPETYSGLILMDIAASQVSDMGTLPKWMQNGKKVLYIPGIREFFEVRPWFEKLGIGTVMEDVSDRLWEWQGRQLTVKTAFDVPELIQSPSDALQVRFAWDTWKWSLMQSSEAVSDTVYEEYWRDAFLFLSSSMLKETRPDRLNWVFGEAFPLKTNHAGVYEMTTTGKSWKLKLSGNDIERNVHFSDPSAAAGMCDSVLDREAFLSDAKRIRSLTDGKPYPAEKRFRLPFRESMLILVLAICCALGGWLLSDLRAAKT